MDNDTPGSTPQHEGAQTEFGYAWVEVSEYLIRRALHMPDDVAIAAAEYRWPAAIRLLCISPELPPVASIEDAPTLTPTVKHSPETFTWDWCLPASPALFPDGEAQ